MKNIIKFSLATLAIATLAACSGGGSKGGNSNTSAPVNTAPAVAQNQNQLHPQASSSTTGATGGSQEAAGGGFYGNSTFQITDVSGHPNVLKIAGRDFPIRSPHISSRGFTKLGAQGGVNVNGKPSIGGVFSGSKFSSAFGYIDAGPHSAVYYQGNNPTKALPKGSATYVGDSVYVNNGKSTTQDGGVNLNVNFDTKTLSGTIFKQQDNIAAVTVSEAKLSGNSFEGKVTQGGKLADLHGKFYGANAEELAGAYSDGTSRGYQGAFGAKKQ